MSKPYQSQIIASVGFRVPRTCITNDEQTALQFQAKYKSVIFKSISSVRSIVQELEPTRKKHLYKIRYLPTQFQHKLSGINIRVHVVGDALFATRVDSQVVDYRYARREDKEAILSPYQLPKPIQKRCFNLSKVLNLPLCGIDLFLTRDDAYYCFEVNPSPGYSYFQVNTGQDIAAAIVSYLEYGKVRGKSMVNIIENWANIEGTVIAITDNPGLPNYYLVQVELKTSLEVEGFPNLAKADEGKIIRVNVKKTELGKNEIKLNATIFCTVRKSFGQLYFIK